jgi:small subunit ribosomal protein S16
MLKIRLKKTGRKNQPFYKIVLMENLTKRDGKAYKELGYYDPLRKIIHFEKELVHSALQNGAYPTDTVRHLLNKAFNFNSCYKLI